MPRPQLASSDMPPAATTGDAGTVDAKTRDAGTASVREPGTLVWVGPKMHPEFVEAFRYCQANTGQLAIRGSLAELIGRPAGFVKRIIIARLDRRPMPSLLTTRILSHYGDAELLTLASGLCDGEARTGTPWTPIRSIRFSRWKEVLPQWLKPCGCRYEPEAAWSSVLILTDRYETAEPLLDYAAMRGRTAVWKRKPSHASIRNFDRVWWDESVASAASADIWRQRLTGATGRIAHTWLATQPHADEIGDAIHGGISEVITKPATLASLF
jgi:hypothetical protein